MHLKLSVNSTRRAKWFAKLGFLNPQRPLVVSLNTIQPNSFIGAIDVFVERVYPILVRLNFLIFIHFFLNSNSNRYKIIVLGEKRRWFNNLSKPKARGES